MAMDTRVGARYASGLSRPHARFLRRRIAAARRSATSQPRTVLSRRDRDTAWPRRLHPPARDDPDVAPRDLDASTAARHAAWLPAVVDPRCAESSLEHPPRTHDEPGPGDRLRRATGICAQSR